MWKLSSLFVVVGFAVFMWFRMNPALPTDSPQYPTSQPAASTGGSAPAGKVSGKPAQVAGGSGRPAKAGESSRSGGRRAALVVTSPVTLALINDRLKAVGSGTAVASVSVVPLSGGILTDMLVTAGQQVKKGDVLALLDNESELIARDRASRAATDAATDATRLTKLYRSKTSTEVELNRAKASLADAELALREAALKLARRTVTAPISGIVGLVPVDKGNYVTPQTELITIDDRSTIIVDFWIPETFANKISLSQPIDAIALANPGKTYKGSVSGIGSRIETDSRTLPVQAKLDNSSDSLRPGMSFELLLKFAGLEYPAIDPLSLQWDSKGSYIWRMSDGKVERVSVTIIQRNPESVLVDAQIAAGDSIVKEGLLSLRPGASVRTAGGRP
jgi:RND family efflux transporter MFP subunit